MERVSCIIDFYQISTFTKLYEQESRVSLKKSRGPYTGLGLFARLCITLTPGQEPLKIGSCNLVCGKSMKIKRTCIFFLSGEPVVVES